MQLMDQDIQMPAGNPETWEALLADCARGVSQVRDGLHGGVAADADTLVAFEKVCTAALLTRLWQDVRVDVMEQGRLFIPADVAAEHGLDLVLMRKALSLDTERGCEGDARDGSCNCAIMPNSAMRIVLPAFRVVMRDLVRRTKVLWDDGLRGLDGLPDEQRRVHRVVEREGRATLRMIARREYDTLTRRPALGGVSRAWLRLRLRLPG
jgi:phytoene/squalene synthetase